MSQIKVIVTILLLVCNIIAAPTARAPKELSPIKVSAHSITVGAPSNSTKCRIILGQHSWKSKGCHKRWSAPFNGSHSDVLSLPKDDSSFAFGNIAQVLRISKQRLKDLAAIRPTAIEIPAENQMYNSQCMTEGAIDWDSLGGVNDKMRTLSKTAFNKVAANTGGVDHSAFKFVLKTALREVFNRIHQYRREREEFCQAIDPSWSPKRFPKMVKVINHRNHTMENGTLHHTIPLEMIYLQRWLDGTYGLKKSDINVDTLKKFAAHYYQALSPVAKLSLASKTAEKVHGHGTANATILSFLDEVSLHRSRDYWFDPILYIFEGKHYFDGKKPQADQSVPASYGELFCRFLVVPYIKEHNLKHNLEANTLFKDTGRQPTGASRSALKLLNKTKSHDPFHIAKINFAGKRLKSAVDATAHNFKTAGPKHTRKTDLAVSEGDALQRRVDKSTLKWKIPLCILFPIGCPIVFMEDIHNVIDQNVKDLVQLKQTAEDIEKNLK